MPAVFEFRLLRVFGISFMHVTIMTAFPEFFDNFLSTSIVGRAVKKGLIRVDLVNLRDFGRGNYRQIDDYAFGSGGMILTAPVLDDALNAAVKKNKKNGKNFIVYPSPQGVLLTQEIIETLANQEHVIILCGHYEGIDERFADEYVDLEVTVGDCVLTGGEIPAMTIIDAMSRLVPGVVGRGQAVADDSFYNGMLDTPHYTRPASWRGRDVPEVLLSGNDADIKNWRRERAVNRTLERRPDLISRAAIRDYISGGVYFAAEFVNNKPDGAAINALISLCRFYELGRPFIIIPDRITRREISELNRLGTPETPRVLGNIERVIEWIGSRVKSRAKLDDDDKKCLVINILSRPEPGVVHILEAKRMCLEHDGPVLFFISDGDIININQAVKDKDNDDINKISNISVEILKVALSSEKGNDNLPLALRASAALDRFLGKR